MWTCCFPHRSASWEDEPVQDSGGDTPGPECPAPYHAEGEAASATESGPLMEPGTGSALGTGSVSSAPSSAGGEASSSQRSSSLLSSVLRSRHGSSSAASAEMALARCSKLKLVIADSAFGSLDLSGMTPSQLQSMPADKRIGLGRKVEALMLPSGCAASVVRGWLQACPHLKSITVPDIQDDGRLLSAIGRRTLREFRTTPPGPVGLTVGLSTTVAVPDHLVTGPNRIRLKQWELKQTPLPMLSPEAFTRIKSVIEFYLFETTTGIGWSFTLSDKRREAMLALMAAAPPELLLSPAAQNYHQVFHRLKAVGNSPIYKGELVNFLRPTLMACWEHITKPKGSTGHELKTQEELYQSAVQQFWLHGGSPEESKGARERILKALLSKSRLGNTCPLKFTLQPLTPLIGDDPAESPPPSAELSQNSPIE
jgi:hypothetical protein